MIILSLLFSSVNAQLYAVLSNYYGDQQLVVLNETNGVIAETIGSINVTFFPVTTNIAMIPGPNPTLVYGFADDTGPGGCLVVIRTNDATVVRSQCWRDLSPMNVAFDVGTGSIFFVAQNDTTNANTVYRWSTSVAIELFTIPDGNTNGVFVVFAFIFQQFATQQQHYQFTRLSAKKRSKGRKLHCAKRAD